VKFAIEFDAVKISHRTTQGGDCLGERRRVHIAKRLLLPPGRRAGVKAESAPVLFLAPVVTAIHASRLSACARAVALHTLLVTQRGAHT
jgi:hypothetical protein